MMQARCAVLDKFKSPAGDAVSLNGYREYVLYQLREVLTMDEIRELMTHFHCGCDEVCDKVVEMRLVGRRENAARKVR